MIELTNLNSFPYMYTIVLTDGISFLHTTELTEEHCTLFQSIDVPADFVLLQRVLVNLRVGVDIPVDVVHELRPDEELKNRFYILRTRIRMKDPADASKLVQVVMALYNLAVSFGDNGEDFEEDDDEGSILPETRL